MGGEIKLTILEAGSPGRLPEVLGRKATSVHLRLLRTPVISVKAAHTALQGQRQREMLSVFRSSLRRV